jgi:hypothetical protein
MNCNVTGCSPSLRRSRMFSVSLQLELDDFHNFLKLDKIFMKSSVKSLRQVVQLSGVANIAAQQITSGL